MKRYLSALLGIAMVGAGAYLFIRKKGTTMEKTTTTLISSDKSIPMGYRRNNPLNMRYYSSIPWLGHLLPNTDGNYEAFKSIEYGYRAALMDIRNKIKDGTNTIRKIVTKWAPAKDGNNPEEYAKIVSSRTGIGQDTILTADKETLINIVMAMAWVENGKYLDYPRRSHVEAGYNLL